MKDQFDFGSVNSLIIANKVCSTILHRWKLVILIFTALPLLLVAQETKKIVMVYPHSLKVETFYVLKSDTSMKHGSYRLEKMGKVLLEGHYQMGNQDSIWTQYNTKGIIRSRGWYENNKRDSIWEFFNDKGELEQRLDFTNDVLLQYKTAYANQQFQIHSGNGFYMSKLDRPPLYVGGNSRFNDYFANEIMMPLHKADVKVTGTVYLAFSIDSLGITSNYHVLKGINKICNEEALRAIKSIPEDWIPGALDGKFVTVEYIVNVVFDEKIRPMEFLPQSTYPLPKKNLLPKKNSIPNIIIPADWYFEEVRF